MRDSGHEHFSGSLVVPVMDENGIISEVYERKTLGNRLRKGTPNISTYPAHIKAYGMLKR